MKRKTASEIVDFVVDHINKNGRALDDRGVCVYLTNDGKRCGHSICIDDNFIINKLKDGDNSSASRVIEVFGDEIHKEEFRGYEPRFWSLIQGLHDTNIFWDENNNLTQEGIEEAEKIKNLTK